MVFATIGGTEISTRMVLGMPSILYFCMLAFFITHELDAIKRHEWRVLPITSFLPDKTGEQVFIWAHVPLFFGLFFFGAFDPQSTVAKALSMFAIVHIGLHVIFRNHKDYEFNNFSSWTLIIACGLFGAAHLAVA